MRHRGGIGRQAAPPVATEAPVKWFALPLGPKRRSPLQLPTALAYWENDRIHSEAPTEPVAATQLDPLESGGTSGEPLATTFRHSGWSAQRRKVAHALTQTNQTWSRQEAFRTCGGNCFVLRSKSNPEDFRLAASGCHDRFCLPCAQARSRTIAANVAAYLKDRRARFVTLTLKHTNRPLRMELDRLYAAFKALRKAPLWKRTQTGGVAFLELKRSRDRLSWHPHLHILTQGKFLDVQKLALLWKSITKDSHIVDVRLPRDSAQAIAYVTKYASKPFDPSLFDNQTTLEEAIEALNHRRMALTFGNWKGLQMTEKPSEDAWEFLDTLEGIAMRAQLGDSAALKILQKVAGDRATWFMELVAKQIVPRMNTARPPTPTPQMYLELPPTPCTGY